MDVSNTKSFLQSNSWKQFQNSIGRKTIDVSVENLSGFAVLPEIGLGQRYCYFPHGPSGEYSVSALNEFILASKKACLPFKPFFLRVEPFLENDKKISQILSESGFKKVRSVQPEETFLLDITKSEDEMLKEMEHNTRYSIRSAEKRGVKVSEASDKKEAFQMFWNMFTKTNARHSLSAYSDKYYREIFSLSGDASSRIFFAYADGRPIASAILIVNGNRATYLFAASERGFEKYNAPTLLLWHIILKSKEIGCAVFDFWGMSTTNKKWSGVTAFKKSFGGRSVKYAGTWDLPINRSMYWLYSIAKKIL